MKSKILFSIYRYLSILSVSVKQEFAYRSSFILWRLRSMIHVVVFIYLWRAIYANSPSQVILGYEIQDIMTYALLLIFVRSLVISSKSIDLSAQISSGDFSNLLLKPVGTFKYWLMRDFGSKALNLTFSFFEMSLIIYLLKVDLFIQTDPVQIIIFLLSILLAVLIFFCLVMLTNTIAFWIPELSWGIQFLFIIVAAEFLSGSFFPLNVLPSALYNLVINLPFSYLVYFPIQSYLGLGDGSFYLTRFAVGLFWLIVLIFCLKFVWRNGLRAYEAYGK